VSVSAIRLPASAVTSMLLHAGFLAGFLLLNQPEKRENLRVISNVGLIVVKRPVALPASAKPAAPPSTFDFLKMALPSIPKIAAPQTLDVKLPEIKKPLLAEPEKLRDAGRLEKAAKLEALDLAQKRLDSMKIEAKEPIRDRTAALANLPRLEEVGARRVKNLPQALALEEKRQEAVSLRQIGGAPPATSKRITQAQAMDILREATPAERGSLGDKMPVLLPSGGALDLRAQRMEAPARPAFKEVAPTAAPRREAAAIDAGKKKGVEIEGPLADRKVLSYQVPAFPDWAKAQNLMEAEVAIRFNVTPAGDVMDEMRVEKTSGFGRLDRLCMDALRGWKFAPISSGEKQWGVITFRFVLE
jgi:TonB family protein